MSTGIATQAPSSDQLPQPVALGTLSATTPAALVAGATDMAGSLSQIIQQQGLAVAIQGKQYVRVEGWTTLGVMMGVVAREVETTEQDGIYTAVVELVRITDGVVVSRASAECGEEKPWNSRPRYARRSMAQTRATSKACRMAFSWVMTLAGYEATPAEEMEPLAHVQNTQAPTYPRSDSLPVEETTSRTAQAPEAIISAKDHRQIEVLISELGLDRDRVKDWLCRATANRPNGPVKHINHLPASMFEAFVTKLDQWSTL